QPRTGSLLAVQRDSQRLPARPPLAVDERLPRLEPRQLAPPLGDREGKGLTLKGLEIRTRIGLLQQADAVAEDVEPLGRDAPLAHRVLAQGLSDPPDTRSVEDEAEVEVPILDGRERFVEAADLEEVGPSHSPQADDEAPFEHVLTLVLGGKRPIAGI